MDYAEILKDKDKYRAEMSAEERMSAYRSGEEVDHQPYALMSSNFAVANVLGYTASDVRNNFDVNCQVIDFMQNELGIETLNVGLGLRSLGQAMGSTLHYPKNDVDSIEKYSIAGFKEIERLCEIDPNNNDFFTSKIESGKKLKEKFPKLTVTTSVAGPFTSAISIMPAETFLKGTIKYPDTVNNLLELIVKNTLSWIDLIKREFGVVSVCINDPVSTANMLSKRQFDVYAFPYLKNLIGGIKKIMGQDPGLHICGKTHPLWEDLVDAGLNYFSLDNCENLENAKQEIGKRTILAGNVPPVDVMLLGSPNDVVNSCIDCLKQAADSPRGFILNTGCQVPIGTSMDNIKAYVYTVQRFGSGAKMGRLPKTLIST